MNQAARGVLLSIIGVCHSLMGQSGPTELLRLETTIPLSDVHGRIDHMSIDLKGQRLFVAALGNNSLEVIDLKINKRVQTIRGLAEAQGTTYGPASNRVFVANRKDGSVKTFDASAWKILQSLSYGTDADNLRVDPSSGHLWVGYGDGALAESCEITSCITLLRLGSVEGHTVFVAFLIGQRRFRALLRPAVPSRLYLSSNRRQALPASTQTCGVKE